MTAAATTTESAAPHTPEAAMAKAQAWMTGCAVVLGFDVGVRTGLLDAAARIGAATSEELAEAAGCSERHVREWLGLMAAGGVLTYDPSSQRFAIPEAFLPLLPSRSASPNSRCSRSTFLPSSGRSKKAAGFPTARTVPNSPI